MFGPCLLFSTLYPSSIVIILMRGGGGGWLLYFNRLPDIL